MTEQTKHFMTVEEADEALIRLGLPQPPRAGYLGESADLSFWYRQLATMLQNRDKALRELIDRWDRSADESMRLRATNELAELLDERKGT